MITAHQAEVQSTGRPTEEPFVDTRPNVHQLLGATAPASGPPAPVSEDTEVVNTEIPKAMVTGGPTRPRQPESEAGSEPSERNVRPRVESELSEPLMDDAEEVTPPTDNEGEVLQGADGSSAARVQPDVSTDSETQTSSHLQTSASMYMTVLPCVTGFDSKGAGDRTREC